MRTYVVKMVGACEIIRLRDMEDLLTKTSLHAWNSRKVCCPHDDCDVFAFFLEIVKSHLNINDRKL